MATSKTPSSAAKRLPKSTPQADVGKSPAELIEARIKELADWRGELLTRLRAAIRQADPKITEDWKWNVPVWSCNGIICTGETYQKAVKLTFAKGARLADPARLSTPAWRAMPGGPLISGKGRRLTRLHWVRWCGKPSRAIRSLEHSAPTMLYEGDTT